MSKKYEKEINCSKCGKQVYLFRSDRTGNLYACDKSDDNTSFHSKTCVKNKQQNSPPKDQQPKQQKQEETLVSHWGKDLPKSKSQLVQTHKKERKDSYCKKCGKQIFWKRSKKTNRPYPVDNQDDPTSFHSKTCTGTRSEVISSQSNNQEVTIPTSNENNKQVDISSYNFDLEKLMQTLRDLSKRPDPSDNPRLLSVDYDFPDGNRIDLVFDLLDFAKLLDKNLDWESQRVNARIFFERILKGLTLLKDELLDYSKLVLGAQN